MKIGRLKKRPQFLKITNKGHKAITKSFVVFCHFGFIDPSDPRAPSDTDLVYGLTVTKKIGNAVVRNRIKRRLRHMIASVQPDIPEPFQNAGLVIIGRPAARDRDFSDLCAELKKCLNWLKKQA